MADTTKSGQAKSLPNFYQAAGQMDAYSGTGAGKSANAKSAADAGEKVASVKTLLEVVRKMDGMEQDPEAKKLLEQVVSLVEQYMEKVQPGAGKGSAAGAGAGSGTPETPPVTGATAGDTTGQTAVM